MSSSLPPIALRTAGSNNATCKLGKTAVTDVQDGQSDRYDSGPFTKCADFPLRPLRSACFGGPAAPENCSKAPRLPPSFPKKRATSDLTIIAVGSARDSAAASVTSPSTRFCLRVVAALRPRSKFDKSSR